MQIKKFMLRGRPQRSKWRLTRRAFAVCHLLLVVLLVGCNGNAVDGLIEASGFIEGKEVIVASETSGRIAEILVERGDKVLQGDVLVRLDDAVLQSQRLQAEAGLTAAQANLARVKAGARLEAVAAAQAALAQAEAERDGAQQAVIHAREVISNPLSLDAEVDQARTHVRLAEQGVELAEAELAEAELWHGQYVGKGGDLERSWDLRLQAAQATLTQAQAELVGAQRYLGALLDIRANPLELETQLHTVEMQYDLAEAQVSAAQAELDDLLAGPTEEELAMAEANVRQAQAAVSLVDAKIAQLTLKAPMDGVVTSRSAHTGETAMAGTPLLTIANLEEVDLVIYIPVDRVGQIGLDDEVEVRVDYASEQVFMGHVTHIAREAEFTPRNVQTQEERVNLVYAVKVRIPNPGPDYQLKLGTPADAVIRP
jgi:multidrug resistance efflux pump